MSEKTDSKILEKLSDFGLSEREAKVYLSLLQAGPSTGNETAQASGIKRSSAYVVLDSLKEKGFIGISDDKNVRRFSAISPETLLENAREKVREQKNIEEGILSIVPELKSFSKKGREEKERPAVRVYAGKDGLREVLNTLGKEKSGKLNHSGLQKSELENLSGVLVFENKVVIVSPKEKIGIIIESPEIIRMVKEKIR